MSHPESLPAPAEPTPPRSSKITRRPAGQWRTGFLSTLGVLLVAIVVAVSLIAFVFQSYEVDGPSMENTLQNNDRLIVWKAARTWARITGHPYIPNRGDIVVFTESGLAAFGQPGEHQLIKRVIGLPGERVVVNNDTITVYNKAHPDGFQPDTAMTYSKDGAILTTAGNIDVTLGDNQLFVCGDNRPESLDSRTFGPINADAIVGKLAVRILPLSNAERF